MGYVAHNIIKDPEWNADHSARLARRSKPWWGKHRVASRVRPGFLGGALFSLAILQEGLVVLETLLDNPR